MRFRILAVVLLVVLFTFTTTIYAGQIYRFVQGQDTLTFQVMDKGGWKTIRLPQDNHLLRDLGTDGKYYPVDFWLFQHSQDKSIFLLTKGEEQAKLYIYNGLKFYEIGFREMDGFLGLGPHNPHLTLYNKPIALKKDLVIVPLMWAESSVFYGLILWSGNQWYAVVLPESGGGKIKNIEVLNISTINISFYNTSIQYQVEVDETNNDFHITEKK